MPIYKKILRLDYKLSKLIYTQVKITPFLDRIFHIISHLYGLIPLAILFIIIGEITKKSIILFIIILITNVLINDIFIKYIFKRKRPNYCNAQISNYSFPSTHAAFFTLCYLFLFNYSETSIIFLIILFIYEFILIIRRVAIGYHFFGDILGGIILAIMEYKLIKYLLLPIIF